MNGITGFDLGDESIASANRGRSFAPNELSDRGNIVGWCGYLYEESTGMWLARHRWQIPELGRWANRDPISYAGGGQNLYEYVNGNPVFFTDSSGLSPDRRSDDDYESADDILDRIDFSRPGSAFVHTRADSAKELARDLNEVVEVVDGAIEAVGEVVDGAVQFVADTMQAIAESHAACVAKCYATERLLRDMAQTALNGAAGAIPGLISIEFDLYSDDWYVPAIGANLPGIADAATDPDLVDDVFKNDRLTERLTGNKAAKAMQELLFKSPLRAGAVGVALAAGQTAWKSTEKSIDYCVDKCNKQRDSELDELDEYCGG